MHEILRFDELLGAIREVVESTEGRRALLEVCRLLKEGVGHYDWVGFYMVDPGTGGELVLGPYVGEPTEHVRIPFGRGICGQAAERRETFVVDDVSKEGNYLACSPYVRSEIVVPIFNDRGQLVAELDIDSHTPASFSAEDRRFLERVAELVSRCISQ